MVYLSLLFAKEKWNKFAVRKLKVAVEDNFNHENRKSVEQPLKNNHRGRFSNLWSLCNGLWDVMMAIVRTFLWSRSNNWK